MNIYKQLLPRTIFLGSLGVAAMLLVGTPSCKAQEVSPDIFTETGVQDVYECPQAKLAAPQAKQNQSAAQTRSHRVNASGTNQSAAKRTTILSAQLNESAVADNRKPTANTARKQ